MRHDRRNGGGQTPGAPHRLQAELVRNARLTPRVLTTRAIATTPRVRDSGTTLTRKPRTDVGGAACVAGGGAQSHEVSRTRACADVAAHQLHKRDSF